MVVKKTTATTKKQTGTIEEVQETVENVEVEVEQKAQTPEPTPAPVAVQTKKVRQKRVLNIDHNDLIECLSTQSNLIYISKRTNEKFEWENLDDALSLTMGELIAMKSGQSRFLSEGWLIVNDSEAIEYLGLEKVYGNMFDIDDMDSFFKLDLDEMKRILSNIPRGFKGTIAYYAREKIQNGELDSRNKVALLEEMLDVDLKIFE